MAGLGAALTPSLPALAQPPTAPGPRMLTRPIPSSGEALPVIGLGTWQTFDVGGAAGERAPLAQVLQKFFASGARLIDSSPMYGRSEAVVGDLLKQSGQEKTPFLATKVWTHGKAEGAAQIQTSLQRMGHGRMDLMQVHNLLDVDTHLPVLRELKAAKKIRYVGVTHYQRGAFDDLEKHIKGSKLDFVQLPYSLAMRDAEARLLPAAKEHGVAVLVMEPFDKGNLFRKMKGRPLPAWAQDFDCASWAQFFLKFILGHPAVNCPIPATSNPAHLEDNVKAGLGRLPDEKTRARMVKLLEG
ncbi:aldo/keto reductase [Corallococcus sp. BB11-1]|uniref:aldo/keto reductase n=1 Tax=Corallococcus sp. BB11-1 TaxID=2996783 RepID=UPI00227084EC|nr:aldo/keto reductase [Corallococcus sp. BB11-1]MCY1030414.1 aldo/keto reductase [Corallococcus sp. BB11-1]